LPVPPRIEGKKPLKAGLVQLVLTVTVPVPARFEQPPPMVE
jgi:hypothetical protein